MENPNSTPSAAQQAENKGSERLFTQDEVNHIVADRLARERSKGAESADDLTARENNLKAREEALAAKTKRFDAWESREACKAYLHDNQISEKLLDKLDTSNVEAFKTAVQAVQKATDGGYTLTTKVTGVTVPPEWMMQRTVDKDAQLKRAFGLKD